MSGRFIDPVEHIRRTADESLGVVTQKNLVIRNEQTGRFDAQPDRTQQLLIFETIELQTFDVAVNTGTAFFHQVPTALTAYTLSSNNADVSAQCRAVVFRLLSRNAITAGTAFLHLSVTEGISSTGYDIAECELNSVDSVAKSVVLDWNVAPQIAKGAVWAMSVQTDAAFLPAAADMKCWITFAYQQWASS